MQLLLDIFLYVDRIGDQLVTRLVFNGSSFGLVTSTAINDVAIAILGGDSNGKLFVKKDIIDEYGEIRPFIHF